MKILVAASALVLLSGCVGTVTQSSAPTPAVVTSATTTAPNPTPSVSSTSVSPAPSPSSTLSPDQEAAVRAVNGIREVAIRTAADPSKFTEAQVRADYARFAARELVQAGVQSYLKVKAKNHRLTGLKEYLITAVSKVVNTKSARGLEVVVTACIDQREVVELDASGKVVDTNLPPFFEMTYTVLKTPGVSGWLAYDVQGRVKSCGN